MSRSDLERLSREELIELVLRLQRPDKTSRTSSKPPATDRKERRDQAKPGGAKPGHEGHSRAISDDLDVVVQHRPDHCACCGGALDGDLPAEVVSVSEQIELPEVAPVVTQHRRLAVRCPTCGTRAAAPMPDAARGTRHALRATAARCGDRPQDLPGAVLRAVARGAVRPVRADAQSGRADEPAPPGGRVLAHLGAVEPTNNGSERLLRPAVVQRKVTNGYRAMWAAEGEAAIRTVVDTARLAGRSPFSTILKTVGA